MYKYKLKKGLYYNQNFKNKKDKNNDVDDGLFEDESESYSLQISKSKIEKTIFKLYEYHYFDKIGSTN